MINIAVMCIDNKDAADKFFNLVDALRNSGVHMRRLIYHQWIVGSDICKVRFFSNKSRESFDDIRGMKFDKSFGFSTKEQAEILKEGCKISRKFVDFRADYTEELLKYFVDNRLLTPKN